MRYNVDFASDSYEKQQGRTVVVHAERVSSAKAPLCRRYKANHCWISQARHIRSTAALWEIREVVVPPFAKSVSEGDVRWEKKPGDQVKEDDVLCKIETDKTSVPVSSPGSDVVKELFVKDGDTVKPGQKLCSIDIGATGMDAPGAYEGAGRAGGGGGETGAGAGLGRLTKLNETYPKQ